MSTRAGAEQQQQEQQQEQQQQQQEPNATARAGVRPGASNQTAAQANTTRAGERPVNASEVNDTSKQSESVGMIRLIGLN